MMMVLEAKNVKNHHLSKENLTPRQIIDKKLKKNLKVISVSLGTIRT
jgi:hypothetical protein